jgi:hypothetical protein
VIPRNGADFRVQRECLLASQSGERDVRVTLPNVDDVGLSLFRRLACGVPFGAALLRQDPVTYVLTCLTFSGSQLKGPSPDVGLVTFSS